MDDVGTPKMIVNTFGTVQKSENKARRHHIGGIISVGTQDFSLSRVF
jgi:hypothetical protein